MFVAAGRATKGGDTMRSPLPSIEIEQCEGLDFIVETPGGGDSRVCRNVEVPVSDQAEKSLKGIISFVSALIILSFGLEFLLFPGMDAEADYE